MVLKIYFNSRLAKSHIQDSPAKRFQVIKMFLGTPEDKEHPTAPGGGPSRLKLAYLRPAYQPNGAALLIKRSFDIVFSLIIITFGAPVFLALFLITWFSSPGPVFYTQERVGCHQRTFKIYKFRSTRVNAEQGIPQLSSANDPRVTRWGRIIRRTRLDELPQFRNVIKGDMSIVGPRPERAYFIQQILNSHPDYHKLNSVRPGITSYSQVKFGYAEDVEQMCTRMEYDLDYLHRMSFYTDVRLILKTVKVMVMCKGK